jgi:GxxExxY protein
MGQLLPGEETCAIRGAVWEPCRELGSGFWEAVYHECLAKEFQRRNLPDLAQEEWRLTYQGEPLIECYKPDFIGG